MIWIKASTDQKKTLQLVKMIYFFLINYNIPLANTIIILVLLFHFTNKTAILLIKSLNY